MHSIWAKDKPALTEGDSEERTLPKFQAKYNDICPEASSDLEDKVHFKGAGTVMTSHVEDSFLPEEAQLIREDYARARLALLTIETEVPKDRRGISEDIVEGPFETSEPSGEPRRELAQDKPRRELAQGPAQLTRVHAPREPRALKTLEDFSRVDSHEEEARYAEPRKAQARPRVLAPAAHKTPSWCNEPRGDPRDFVQAAWKTRPDSPHPHECSELSPWTSQVHDPCALNARKTKPNEEQDISARSNEPCGEGGFKWEHEPGALMAQFEWRSRTFLDLDLSPSSPI